MEINDDYYKTTFNDLRDALQDVWKICEEEEHNLDLGEEKLKIGQIIYNLEKRAEDCCDCFNTKEY